MKTLYNLLFLCFVMAYSHGQTQQVLYKSFDTDRQTTAMLNLNNTNVLIERSTDGQMHFEYTVEFKNYSKKERKRILDAIKVEVSSFENNIHLETSSFGHMISYKVDAGLILNNAYFKNNKTKDSVYVRKSKDSIIRQIETTPLDDMKRFAQYFKVVDDQGNTSNVKSKNVKIQKSRFVIKVPPYVQLNILAEMSNITIDHDFLNELNLTAVGGLFKAKHLQNPNNNLEITDAGLKIEAISNGVYRFKKIKQGMIATLENTVINSEFSEIECGEIGANVKIIDFNSTYWFYNWGTDFKRFDLDSEYSKIHYFYPVADYSLNVVGNNTINYIGATKLVLQPTRNGEKFKMIERKAKGGQPFSGAINIDIVHGIIYSHDDEVTYINKDD